MKTKRRSWAQTAFIIISALLVLSMVLSLVASVFMR